MKSADGNIKWYDVAFLVGVNILYALVGIFTKFASQHEFLSELYFVGLFGAVLMLGTYAVCWQQILKRVELSTAYMFKGTSLIFVMLLALLFFGETISIMNIVGAAVIITGIMLFAKE